MQLDQLTIQPRPRSAWSALDLGLLVAKQNWISHSVLWLMMALPLFIVLSVALPETYLWIAYVATWWFKPLYERALLYRLSQELFAESVTNREVFRAWRQWLLPGWFLSITLRRFSFARSFFMPVIILEKLQGKAYGKRVSVLGGKGSNEAFWLTTVLVHIEALLPFSLLALLAFLDPVGQLLSIDVFDENPSLFQEVLLNSMAVVASACMAPLYVSCGFMLYICRRIELEGWDIEICFRNLVSRLKER